MNKNIRQFPLTDLKLIAIVSTEIEDMRSEADHEDYPGPDFAVIHSHEVYGNADAEFALWQERGSVDTNCRCALCGKLLKYNCVVQHVPTGEFYNIGRDCLEAIECLKGANKWLAFKHEKLAEWVAAGKKAHKARLAGDVREAEFAASSPAHHAALQYAREFDNNHPLWHKVSWQITTLRDIRGRLRKYGSISDKTGDLVLRLHSEAVESIASCQSEIAAREQALASGVRAPEGKQTITGTVLGTKFVDSDFGGSWKAIIDLGNGTRVYGTIPGAELGVTYVSGRLDDGRACQIHISRIEKGDTVTFSATFEVSQKDSLFGFYKRPTKWTNPTYQARLREAEERAKAPLATA